MRDARDPTSPSVGNAVDVEPARPTEANCKPERERSHGADMVKKWSRARPTYSKNRGKKAPSSCRKCSRSAPEIL